MYNCLLFWKLTFKLALIGENKGYFDVPFTKFSKWEKTKIPSAHISLTYMHTYIYTHILLTLMAIFAFPILPSQFNTENAKTGLLLDIAAAICIISFFISLFVYLFIYL